MYQSSKVLMFWLLYALGIAWCLVFMASKVNAALDLAGTMVDTVDYLTIAAFLIGALVAFWGIRKALGLFGDVSIKSERPGASAQDDADSMYSAMRWENSRHLDPWWE